MPRTDSSTSNVRLLRLFRIHHQLRSLKAFSADELASFCQKIDPQVNPRKIREDVQFLRSLGADIPKGNKHAKFSYKRPFSLLSVLEGVNTADTDEVLDYLRQIYQNAPKAAFLELDKVFLALEKRIRTAEAQGDPRLQFEKLEYVGGEYITALLEFAVKKHAVQYVYEPFMQQRRDCIVYPVFLKEYNHRWYLIGFDREAGRYLNYALDRIKSQPRPAEWWPRVEQLPDPSTYFKDLIGVTLEGELARVVVRVQKPRAFYIRTKHLHSPQQEVGESDQWIDFQWELLLNRELTARILELGDDAEVLEPLTLREEIAKRLEAALMRYKK